MLIRQANTGDLPTIKLLAEEIWWTAYKGILSDEQISFMLNDIYSLAPLKARLAEGVEMILAESNSKPSGFAEYSLKNPAGKVFRIHKLYILPSEQGKGVGKALMEYITNNAKIRRGNMLELNVNRGNPALKFYEKLGFEIVESVDIPYHSFVLNDYVMQKKI